MPPSQNITRAPILRYYSNSTSFTADVPEIEKTKIAQTARLDLMWPTMYNNSDDTKAILIGAELPNSSEVRP